MGSICATQDEQTSKLINDFYEKQHKKEERIKKILLLGSGASGKSTLFKQFGFLHGMHSFDKEFTYDRQYTALINMRANMTQHICVLLRKSEQLYESDNKEYESCKININKYLKEIKTVAKYGDNRALGLFGNSMNDKDLKKIGNAIDILWNLDEIQETYRLRTLYSFSDNMDYFYNKTLEIFRIDYMCTKEDYIKTRVRTTGVLQLELQHVSNGQTNKLKIIDVGGQRSERSKWIHQFSTVTAVIFVAALNHYCTVLFEDENKNAMIESIELFEEITSLRHFHSTQFILFFNKYDLYQSSIKKGLTLDMCFNSNTNDLWPSVKPQWNPNDPTINYDKNRIFDNDNTGNKKRDYYEHCCQKAYQFIQQRYIDVVPDKHKGIFTHKVSATDVTMVDTVYQFVQNKIITTTLNKSGLH